MPPLLRYAGLELVLVQPLAGGFWRAPAEPWEGPWPPEECEEVSVWESADRSFRAHLERHPEAATAPAAWPAELAVLVLELLENVWRRRFVGWRGWLMTIGPLGRVTVGNLGLRRMAERASARRRGLDAATAPRPRLGDMALTYGGVLIAATAIQRLRGRGRLPTPPWNHELARRLILAFNRRRSWRRAYAAARASQDLSSASSRTSDGWAPETP